jgi:signal transduction histidine kinase
MAGAAPPRGSISGIFIRALALVALVPFLPLAILIFTGYRDDVARVEREIQTTNAQIALLAAHYLDRFVQGVHAQAQLAARLGAAELPERSSGVSWELVDADGTVRATQLDPARVGRDCGYDRFLATVGVDREPVHSSVERWLDGYPPAVLIVLRTDAARGSRAVVGVTDPAGLHAELAATAGDPLDRRVYVVDRTGAPLFYSDLEVFRRGQDLRDNPPVRLFRKGRSGPLRYRSTVTDKERLGVVQPTRSGEWAVVASADLGTALIGLRGRYLALTWSILFALVAAAVIVAWTSRRLTRPVLQIRDALRSEGRREHRPLEVSPKALGTVEYAELVRAFDDLEARLAVTEASLIHAEKTALLGQLTTGIAHEFGTPLNVMSGYAQVLMRKLPAENPDRQVLGKIVEQAQRLAKLIRRMLDFARPTDVRLQPVDVREVVAQVLEMAAGMGKKVQVRMQVADGLPRALGDPRLLEHALLNLIVNGIQAMPDGGVLTVEAAEEEARAARGERGVAVRVSDTGCGIPAEHRAKIFEPFFTTKPPGEGTGLGLAIVERIVQQHGGRIEVDDAPGGGTRFTLVLRRAEGAGEDDDEEEHDGGRSEGS